IAIYTASWLLGDGGPLQNSADKTVPVSNDIADSAKLPVFWGQQQLQGLHIGFFVAIAALVVFYVMLNRTTLGYEVRAVGSNPDAAAYGGIDVKKHLDRDSARARRQPDLHHPRADRAVRRRGRSHPLHLEHAAEAPATARAAGEGDRMTTLVERLDNPISSRLRDPGVTGYTGIALG